MPNKIRLPYIDLLRGFSIMLMFITHMYRLHVPATTDSFIFKVLFDFFMTIEPLTAALFLFLMGFSLQITHQTMTDQTEWLKKQKRKSLILIGLSTILCIAEEGLFPVRIIFASGILSAIAVATMIISIILSNKNSNKLLLFSFITTGLITYVIDSSNISIIGLNAGNGALFPIIGFSFLGAFISKNHKNFQDIEITTSNLLKVIASLFLFIISLKFNWINIINSTAYGLSIQDFQLKLNSFSNWNHSLVGFFSNSYIIMIIYIFLRNIKMNPNTFIHLFGRYSLELYVFHLSIISFFYLLNTGIPGNGLVLFLLILLYIAAYKLTLFLSKNKIKIIK